MRNEMSFGSKKYLSNANNALPSGWELHEGKRIAETSGAPTFSLRLMWKTPFGGVHFWVVEVDAPRHVLKKYVEKVEREGLLALTKLGYTGRVRWIGYTDETIGLREALRFADPSLATVFDSQEFNSEFPE